MHVSPCEGGYNYMRRQRRIHGCVIRLQRRNHVVLKKRIRALRKLVPGGHGFELGKLFMEAADYIVFMKRKVKAMQALTHKTSLDQLLDNNEELLTPAFFFRIKRYQCAAAQLLTDLYEDPAARSDSLSDVREAVGNTEKRPAVLPDQILDERVSRLRGTAQENGGGE
ncbi:hypothetical protein KSP40_PGU016841 [Platanthera guangdongensis]|uniref:Uncharacterized protein n=1 Tax=Platanthera guangdongensis TaxID=2320717 RepID=A0ABR2LEE8_9ASPA